MATADRKRILVLVKGLGLGGAEKLIAQSARVWDRESFEYRVAYLLPWKDQLVSEIQETGVRVTCVGWKGPWDVAGYVRLRRVVTAFSPDLIHTHLPAAGILARTLPGAHVYTEHNVVDFYRPTTKLLNSATYYRNKAVIAVSDAVAASVSGYRGPRIEVIPNGIITPQPTRSRSEIREELGLADEISMITHVGNIRPHKGHRTLIDATATLREIRRDVHIVSIGAEKHPGDLDRVRGWADSAGVSEVMSFLGRRSDASSFIAAADVVVNPADIEGLPLALLEGMALERPVVATAVGGVPSVVRHHETGLLVSPGSPVELAEAIGEALDSPAAAEWAARGRDLVAQRHGISTMISAYEDLYRRIE